MRMLLAISVVLMASTSFAADMSVQRDLAYAEPKNERQTLDVYSPPRGQNHPIIVWIHGGGWRQGDKAGVQRKPQAFVERGFVFASINYRFVPQVTVKEMMADVAKAIGWLHGHAKEHGGDPNTMFVMGHSAAHLAALVCTDPSYLKAQGLPLSIIKGCVPVDTAAYDVVKRMADAPAGAANAEAVFGTLADLHKDLSPTMHVAKGRSIPPFLIVHVADRAESRVQSQHFAKALQDAGVPVRVVPGEGKTHGTINSELGLPEDKPTQAVFAFLKEAQGASKLPATEFRAGAFAQPISPNKFPAPVNGNMKGAFANSVNDHMHARCLALADDRKELIFCIVDACMIPREICEVAKQIASRKTGVPASQMLIAATHTHSAATLAPVFQSDPDPEYLATLPERIAQAIVQAHENLEPAEIAWGKADEPGQVFNRRWLLKEGETNTNPLEATTDRALMNPGYQNAKVSKPSGPVDPEVAILAVRSARDKRPLAILANYSLHYVGGQPAISADYFAAFADQIAQRLGAQDARYQGKPAFVGIMSNGTSGNINNANYAGPAPPRRQPGEQIQKVAGSVADAAKKAFDQLVFQPQVALDCLEQDLTLKVRKATPEQLSRAREVLATTPKDADGQFSDRTAIYAREAVLLDAYPDAVPVKLQVCRIGNLSVAAIPCEVFVEIGLDLKKRTPFDQHFTISLANGYNGYLPTAEHHQLGGYETWRARSSYLEVGAAAQIVERLRNMLGQMNERK